MEDELLLYVYHRLFPSPSSRPGRRCTYSDAVVALVHLYAVMRGRSHRWAADKRNWPPWARRLEFPSYSQQMRRVRRPQVAALVDQLNREFRDRLPRSAAKVVDGKPLTVGGFSKDKDARRGKVPAGWGRGYKLHAVVDECGAVEAFAVTPLDRGEPTVARGLVAQLDLTGATVRSDSNYDSNRLYADVAARGGRLVAPRKKPHTSLGHHAQHPDRLRAIRQLEMCDQAYEAHERHRIAVEQAFARLTNLPFGLAPLPNFVRRLPRVRRWVAAKIMLYHAYRSLLLEERDSEAA